MDSTQKIRLGIVLSDPRDLITHKKFSKEKVSTSPSGLFPASADL